MESRALVPVDELIALSAAGDPPLLLDVRWSLAGSDRSGYAAGHLPGAVFCDLDVDLAAPPGDGGRHPLPSVESMTATLRRLGVTPDRAVVVYDGGAGAAAARAWWCLRWVGHPRVRVLDGGLAAWLAADGPLEAGDVAPSPVAPSSERAPTRRASMPVVSVDDVLAGRAGTLLDARSAERYRGEVEPVDPVAGHIPGARSCPTTALQHPDGRYLPPDALRAVLAPLVGDPSGPVTAYCGSGVTASQLVLAAHEVGLDVALYPGSWSHWVRDPARPVATGESAGR
ncbi:MAG TPA: sulfurtransferase [Actinotalea sp.]|nr:sulfurtransferase [Actinotalea sp.]